MKLTKELIVVCDHAMVSQDGKINIIGLFDEVRVSKFPGGIARLYLAAVLNGDKNQSHKFSITLTKENTDKNLLNPISIEGFVGENGKINILIEILNIIFPKEGVYFINLYANGEKCTSTRLKVYPIKESGSKPTN